VVVDGRVAANVVASQTALHAEYGGVMPEQASREHLAVIGDVVERALSEAGIGQNDLDAVAATHGPGLVGALLVGLAFGKAMAWSLGIEFVKVHHLEGHIASCLADGDVPAPFLCLLASGGHTSLFDVQDWGSYRELGRTRDDAAGEAFDKVARLLGLDYPGGPELSRVAQRGDASAVDLPLPLRGQSGYEFSFSGLKTAVATLVERQPDVRREDVAAAFEQIVVDALVGPLVRAAHDLGRTRAVVAGGVAANRLLRARLAESGLEISLPPLALATDNGAMIALAASRKQPDRPSDWLADAAPYLPLDTAGASSASS
jgi:N6-L-threonylcarbamoyladenine synthase